MDPGDIFNCVSFSALNQQQAATRSQLDFRALKQMLDTQSLVDCTLACDGGKISAHKVVLTACSSYLAKILQDHPVEHPIIILPELSIEDVRSLIHYMYTGELMKPTSAITSGQASNSLSLLRTAAILSINSLHDLLAVNNNKMTATAASAAAVAVALQQQQQQQRSGLMQLSPLLVAGLHQQSKSYQPQNFVSSDSLATKLSELSSNLGLASANFGLFNYNSSNNNAKSINSSSSSPSSGCSSLSTSASSTPQSQQHQQQQQQQDPSVNPSIVEQIVEAMRPSANKVTTPPAQDSTPTSSPSAITTTSTTTIKASILPNEYQFKCPVCHNHFQTICSFEYHMQRIHQVTSFGCEICHKPFASLRYVLLDHMRRCHGWKGRDQASNSSQQQLQQATPARQVTL